MMYRSRFEDNIDKTVLNYISSINDDHKIISYDIICNQIHVIMLYENKLIKKNDTKKILLALENININSKQHLCNYEDVHELIESSVIKKTGILYGGRMHTARSRNDQISFDLRMKLRDDVNNLCIVILDVINSLLSFAKKHQKTVIPLYTHLQQAQVGLLSHYILSYIDSFFRDLDRLYSVYDRINECPLGSGPIGGTSLHINRQTPVKILKFNKIIENSIDATSTRDFVAEYVSTTSILMTTISRMSEDFIIWSTSEFSFVELPDNFASTSSIMPQKKNPDVLEIIRGKTSCVIGNLVSILTIMKGIPSGYNRDLQQIKPSLWSVSDIAIDTLLVIKIMFLGIKIKKDNMSIATEKGYLIALDIVEELVKQDIPFRIAHNIVGKLVKTAYDLNKSIIDLDFNELHKTIPTDIDIDSLFKIIKSITVKTSLQKRISTGSSGFHEQKRMIKDRLKKTRIYTTKSNKLNSDIKNSLLCLSSKINKILGRV